VINDGAKIGCEGAKTQDTAALFLQLRFTQANCAFYIVTRGVDPYGTGGTCPPPNIYEGGTTMVMSPQYFRSHVV